MNITSTEFILMQKEILSLCGVLIKVEQHYVIQHRLGPVAEAAGCKSFSELHHQLRNDASTKLATEVVNAITTNETFFFRDNHSFLTLKTKIMPILMERIQKRKRMAGPADSKIRIWSMAASTGQEAYSIAMLIDECLHEHHRFDLTTDDFHILSTDISSNVLTQAKEGVYNRIEMSRGLSADRKVRYFEQKKDTWQIKKTLRDMVDFRYMNLTRPFPMLGQFDLLLCRNILIYFDRQTRRNLYQKFHKTLHPEGYLLLGALENMSQITEMFESKRIDSTLLYVKQ